MTDQRRPPTWWENVQNAWGHWLHATYALLLTVSLLAIGATEAKDLKVLIAYIAVFIYVVILLLFLAYFIISYARKARYAEAMYCIHSAIHEIRDLHAYLEYCRKNPITYERAHFEEVLRTVLDSLIQALDIVSAVGNRACIKVLTGGEGHEFAQTLCRDSASNIRHKDDDHNEHDKHLIDRNTDFHLIVKGEKRYFLCNDLTKYPNYMNTSLGPNIHSAVPWSLPYVSSLVLPIRLAKDASGTGATRIRVFGFLAVDSAARGAYRERFDVEMGAIVADALFPLLELWNYVEAESRIARSKNGSTQVDSKVSNASVN